MSDRMATLGVAGLIAVGVAAFLLIALPLAFWVNRAMGSAYLREADRVKAELAQAPLGYSEDAVRIRVAGVGFLAVSVRWLWADVRVNRRALYVMQWHRMWGSRIGQPNLRVTWTDEPRVGGVLSAPIAGEPTIEDGVVIVPVRLRLKTLGSIPRLEASAASARGGGTEPRPGWSSLTIRLRARDPRALLDAIHAMR